MPTTAIGRKKLPKYTLLARELRSQIERGDLRPGDRLPSFIEMKDQHGVSRPVVERVHAVLEQEGLVNRIPNRGMFVASARKRNRTNVIGVLGFGFREQPRTWYWTKLLEGIQETASLHNQHILLLDSQLARVIELVDGVLLSDLTAEYQVRALPPGLACVSLLHPLRGRPGVSMDDFSAGQVATEYLLELGHRRIACIELPESISRRRIAGFYDAMENAGLEINPRWVRPLGKLRWPNPHFEAHSYAMVSLWLQQDWRELGCTAILAQNDLVATGATRALQAAGLDVPGDVSVIGFDGGEICDHLSPRLTSVTLPLREMGALGMQMLMDHIEGKPVLAANTMLPPRLDIRESTGPPPESN